MMSANAAVQVEAKERPIIFGAESVRAILNGSKTQTRRVFKFPAHMLKHESADWVKAIHEDGGGNWIAWSTDAPGYAEFTKQAYPNGEGFPCPYGKPGERLWVREKLHIAPLAWARKDPSGVCYAADGDCPVTPQWRSPMLMPRWASRITLELTEVRVERLQDINTERHDEVLKEGWPFEPEDLTRAENPVSAFRRGWDRLNKARGFGWDANPFVWVLSFKRLSIIYSTEAA